MGEWKYLIWSFEHRGWWKPSRHGYTDQRAEAGEYDLEEALQLCRDANRYNQGNPHEALVPVHATPIADHENHK